jgi:putative flippase GtrA
LAYRSAAFGTTNLWEFGRFALVGGASALSYSLMSAALKIWLQLPTAFASIIAYILMLVPTYLMQRHFTFRSQAPMRRSFPRYIMIHSVLIFTGAMASTKLVETYGWTPLPAFLLVGPLLAISSFMLQKLWTFIEEV